MQIVPPRQYYRDFAEAPDNPYQQSRGFRSPFGGQVDPADIFADILRQRGGAARGEYSDQGFATDGQDLRFALEVSFLDAARGAQMDVTLGVTNDIAVKIPPGAYDGQTLRLRGKGGPGHRGGPPGDALITLSVRQHPVFQRDGDDILITLPITIDEAILGSKVTAPTIAGPVSLTIPAGASSGRMMRLRGRGVARRGQKTSGDQLVELKIVSPPVIDESLRNFLSDWRKSQNYDPRQDILIEAER